ncbi:hypothetical protein [Pseudomonas sp. NPDC087817]|uniref:hypothetical protein n=1 Tax=Pseudomonas sp. NPDC087817 TaxID=3364451 RepID=UPI0037F785A7
MIYDPYRRELLYRKAQYKNVLGRYSKKTSLLLAHPFDERLLLSLPATDSIISDLRSRREILCEFTEFSSIAECLRFTSSLMDDREYYLLMDEDWKFCGAYKVKSGVRLCEGFDFDSTDSDEIRLISSDFTAQFSIDYSVTGFSRTLDCCIRRYG